ncbi:putative 4-hydroxy-4-methyl-2-oxoglutarate aldolase, partial [Dissostichus eleginoides]
ALHICAPCFIPHLRQHPKLPSARLLATPLLQSHPAFWDKENTGDQFCSVTFGGGLQSK